MRGSGFRVDSYGFTIQGLRYGEKGFTQRVAAVKHMCQPVSVTGKLKWWLTNKLLLSSTMHTALKMEASIPAPTSRRKRAISPAEERAAEPPTARMPASRESRV